MAIASLILGVIGIMLALTPWYAATQMVGALLGLAALTLGLRARRRSARLRQGTQQLRWGTAGVVSGLVAMALGTLIFASCQGIKYWVSEDQEVARGIKDARDQFQRLMQQAIGQTDQQRKGH